MIVDVELIHAEVIIPCYGSSSFYSAAADAAAMAASLTAAMTAAASSSSCFFCAAAAATVCAADPARPQTGKRRSSLLNFFWPEASPPVLFIVPSCKNNDQLYFHIPVIFLYNLNFQMNSNDKVAIDTLKRIGYFSLFGGYKHLFRIPLTKNELLPYKLW